MTFTSLESRDVSIRDTNVFNYTRQTFAVVQSTRSLSFARILSSSLLLIIVAHLYLLISFYVFTYSTIVSIEPCNIGNKFYRARGSPAASRESSRGGIGVDKVSNSREAWTARHVARPFTEQLARVRNATNSSFFRDFNDSARSLDVA